MTPAWHLFAPRIGKIAALVDHGNPDQIAHLDQYGAVIRDVLDDLGLDTADPDALWALLAGLVTVEALYTLGARRGQVAPIFGHQLATVTNGIIAALLPHLPAEAKAR